MLRDFCSSIPESQDPPPPTVEGHSGSGFVDLGNRGLDAYSGFISST